jgi:hypothetical protein
MQNNILFKIIKSDMDKSVITRVSWENDEKYSLRVAKDLM